MKLASRSIILDLFQGSRDIQQTRQLPCRLVYMCVCVSKNNLRNIYNNYIKIIYIYKGNYILFIDLFYLNGKNILFG